MSDEIGPGDAAYWPAAVNIAVPIVMVMLFIVTLVIVSLIKDRVPKNEDADIEAKVNKRIQQEQESRIKEISVTKVSFDTEGIHIDDKPTTSSSNTDISEHNFNVQEIKSSRKRTQSCTEATPPGAESRRMRTYSQRSHPEDVDNPLGQRRISRSSIVSAISNFSQIDRNYDLTPQFEYVQQRQRRASHAETVAERKDSKTERKRTLSGSGATRPRSLSDALPGAQRHKSHSQLETITSGVQLETPSTVQVELHDSVFSESPTELNASELDTTGTRV